MPSPNTNVSWRSIHQAVTRLAVSTTIAETRILFDRLQEAVANGADINALDPSGNSPLGAAMLLLEPGAEEVDEGMSWAVGWLKSQGAKLVVEHEDIPHEKKNVWRVWSDWQKARAQANVQAASNEAAPSPAAQELKPAHDWQAIHAQVMKLSFATEDAEVEAGMAALKKLVAEGADINALSPGGDSPMAAILSSRYPGAPDKGAARAFAYLLAQDAKVVWGGETLPCGAKDFLHSGNSANFPSLVELQAKKLAFNVAEMRSAQDVEDWIKRGGDVNVRGRVTQTLNTPLIDVVQRYATIQSISKGASPETQARAKEDLAALRSVAVALIEKGADVNFQNKDGQTALHIAAKVGAYDLVGPLMSHGANPYIEDRNGMPAFTKKDQMAFESAMQRDSLQLLDVVARYGQEEKNFKLTLGQESADAMQQLLGEAKALIAKGVNINQQDSDGNTALHIAAQTDSVAMVKVLMDGGIDYGVLNKQGQTAREIAATQQGVAQNVDVNLDVGKLAQENQSAEVRAKFETEAYVDAFNVPEPMARMLLTRDEFSKFKSVANEYIEARYQHAHVARYMLQGFKEKHPGVTDTAASNEGALLRGIQSFYDAQRDRFGAAFAAFSNVSNKIAPIMHERLTALEKVLATNAEAFFTKMWHRQFSVSRETAHKTIVGHENLGEVVEDAVKLLTDASVSCGRVERKISEQKGDLAKGSEAVEELKDAQRLAKALSTSFVVAVVDAENAIDEKRHAQTPSVWLPMDMDALLPQKAVQEKSVPESPKNTTNGGMRPV